MTASSVYDHPLSKILSKADGILLDGLKYSAYNFSIKQKNANKDASPGADEQKKEISISKMLKTHQEKRKIWNKKQKSNNKTETLNDLDNVQSEEIEKVVPIRAQADHKISRNEAVTYSVPDSCRNENR